MVATTQVSATVMLVPRVICTLGWSAIRWGGAVGATGVLLLLSDGGGGGLL